jgi:hypothetical protein
MDSQWTTAIAAVVTGGAAVVYTIVTWRLWQETKRQAITAQRMLDAAHRPWLSIALHIDHGSSDAALNVASIFENHGTVPATVTKATMRGVSANKTWGEGEQLVPTGNPQNLCIFPGRKAELGWGIPNVFAPGAFLRLTVEVVYRGAFERTYQTTIEVSVPVPHGTFTGRVERPMDVVRVETT